MLEKVLLLFVPFRSQIFDVFFGLSHFFNVISIDFIRYSALSAFILCNVHACKVENAKIKDVYA